MSIAMEPIACNGHRKPAAWQRSAFAIAAGGACILLLLLLHARNSLDSDEGVVLNGAWNLLNGRALYIDFFEFLAPGSFYLVFAAWKAFGDSYWVAKCLGIGALAAGAWGIYRTGELVVGDQAGAFPRVALLASLVLFSLFSGYWPTVNHNTFHVPLAVWGTYFVLRGLQTSSWRMYAAAGLLCGVGVWFLQHRAAVMAATTLLVLVGVAFKDSSLGRWRGLAVYLAALLVPLFALLLCWPASVLFEHLIVFPATRYLEINAVEPTLFLWTASLALVAAWVLRNRCEPAIWLLLVLQAALLLIALQRADLSHVTSALFPLLALLPALLAATSTYGERLLQTFIAAGLLSLTVPLIAFATTNRAFLLTDWSRHPALEFVRDRCWSPYLYAGPFAPGLYYETRRLNPTRYSILLPHLHSEAQFVEARADLEARHPPCIVTHYGVAEKFRYSKENPVDTWVSANYKVVFEFRELQVWMAALGPSTTTDLSR